jgi:acyl-CoA reductase-like NAD-dependent aldehyde dehydrogenase
VAARLPVKKTYKLFIGGAFPRSESGRTYLAEGQNVARGSRKDLRDAVRAARSAFPKWSGMTAYNRGQVLYRVAEMVEARQAEFAELSSGRAEVERAIDRVVWYAGWADKLAQVVGSANPVAGPYFNFTVPEPTGVVGILAPEEPPLLGLVSRLAPAGTRSSRSRPRRIRSPRSSWPRRSRPPTSRGEPSTCSPGSGGSSLPCSPRTWT